MRVVGWELLCEAVAGVERATEWPHYTIFVYLAQYDAVMMTRRDRFLHGDLFGLMHLDWIRRGNPELELINDQVFMGHVEWEDDGSFLARTEDGKRLPIDIGEQLVALLDKAKRKLQ